MCSIELSYRHVYAVGAILRIGLIVVLFAASGCHAQDGPPKLKELIADTLTLCDSDRESHSAALIDLAEAQAYLGDFAAARKTLPPLKRDNFFRLAAHQKCAQLEIEMTGSTASIPAELWNDDFGFLHGDAAVVHLERGEIEQVLHHVGAIPRTLHSAMNMYAPKLVPKLRSGNQRDACRKVLQNWAACYEKADSVFDLRDAHQVPQLVAWLVEFDQRSTATSLCARFHTVVQAETDVDECGAFIGRAWAEYAQAVAAVGDRNEARLALDQARLWVDRARDHQLDADKRVDHIRLAQDYAAIAARQAVVLGAEESLTAREKAYDFARQSLGTDYGEFAFEKIVDEQLKVGDGNGARETIKRIVTPRNIANCWKRICKYELARGDAEAARAAARTAVAALDRDGFEPFMAQEMAPVAAAAALAGEKGLARRLFRRALSLSESNESPKVNHPWIARIQVHAGLLSDAYQTIQSVDEPPDRIQPLAELCKALAKAEYDANRDARRPTPR